MATHNQEDKDIQQVEEKAVRTYSKQELDIASLTGAYKAYRTLLNAHQSQLLPRQIEIIKGLVYPVLENLERLGVKVSTTPEYLQWKQVNVH